MSITKLITTLSLAVALITMITSIRFQHTHRQLTSMTQINFIAKAQITLIGARIEIIELQVDGKKAIP